jgi:hypothetical protein
LRDSEYASQKIIATFTISAGCTCTGPSLSQRAAPPAVLPIIEVAASSATVPTMIGYVSGRRRW